MTGRLADGGFATVEVRLARQPGRQPRLRRDPGPPRHRDHHRARRRAGRCRGVAGAVSGAASGGLTGCSLPRRPPPGLGELLRPRALGLEHPARIFRRQRAHRVEGVEVVGRQVHLRRGDVVVELRPGVLAPTMTLVTTGWCSSQASAICATETPRRSAIGASRRCRLGRGRASTGGKSKAARRPSPFGARRERTCRESRPPASGLQTIRPTFSRSEHRHDLALQVAAGERVIGLQAREAARGPRARRCPAPSRSARPPSSRRRRSGRGRAGRGCRAPAASPRSGVAGSKPWIW